MEDLFQSSLLDLPVEGQRLKKFRKNIFDQLLKFTKEFNEANGKKQFQAILDNYTDQGTVNVDNGFIKLLKKMNNKKRNHEEFSNTTTTEMDSGNGDEGGTEERTPFESAIINLLNDLSSEGIRLKKFRQTILDQFATTGDLASLKTEFATAFEKICNENLAKEDNGMVTRIGDKVMTKRMKVSLPPVDQEVAKKEMWKYGEQAWKDGTLDQDYLVNNPDGITRLFCGNLKKTITEEQLHNAINGIVYIKWMTDKNTREFYGSTFLEMKDPAAAAAAVLLDKTKLLGRPLKIYYCPPRPGDVWPPVENTQQRKTNLSNNQSAPRALHDIRPKPPGGRKLFCGNLSYSIDDDILCDFFKDCGELTGLRWLTRQGTGEFRGCAFVEFATTEAADRAIQLNGEMLLDRSTLSIWIELISS